MKGKRTQGKGRDRNIWTLIRPIPSGGLWVKSKVITMIYYMVKCSGLFWAIQKPFNPVQMLANTNHLTDNLVNKLM